VHVRQQDTAWAVSWHVARVWGAFIVEEESLRDFRTKIHNILD
jgi:hypothetical protein